MTKNSDPDDSRSHGDGSGRPQAPSLRNLAGRPRAPLIRYRADGSARTGLPTPSIRRSLVEILDEALKLLDSDYGEIEEEGGQGADRNTSKSK
jgi:hypothetical protein